MNHNLTAGAAETLAYLLEQSSREAPQESKPDFGLLTYAVLQETIHNFVKDGQTLIDQAIQKSEGLRELHRYPDP